MVLLFLHPISIAIYICGLFITVYTALEEEKFITGPFSEYGNYKNRTGMFIPKLLGNGNESLLLINNLNLPLCEVGNVNPVKFVSLFNGVNIPLFCIILVLT